MTFAEFFGFKPRPRPKPRLPQLKLGDSFLFLGRSITLQFVVTLNKKTFFSVFENQLLLHVPQEQWSTQWPAGSRYPHYELMIRFYEKEGRAWLGKRTRYWAEQMQLHPQKVKFRAPKTRWGSCSSAGSINFNWKLIVFPREVIDYVIIHELAHLKHLNHSRDFWQLVQQHCPEYKLHEKTLKTNHGDVQFLKT